MDARPFLLYRDGAGDHAVFELDELLGPVTIRRRSSNDAALPWDPEVSRVHAERAPMGGGWVVCDEGISRNGTFLNGRRIRGRRALHGGDVIAVGDTQLAFCTAAGGSTSVTAEAGAAATAVEVTPAQRRVLEALCRPLGGSGYSAPASNAQIAEELVLSVETVKGTLKALFERFGLEGLPQNQKRAALAARALPLLRGD